ncbi:MAG: hypothetical protein H7Y05_12775 [Steroidobacteraceae bacterium]|nr:hypothetical protein [Deltaproteobacteria bacterium]
MTDKKAPESFTVTVNDASETTIIDNTPESSVKTKPAKGDSHADQA